MTARQTISLPTELEAAVRTKAGKMKRTISSIVTEALNEYVGKRKTGEKVATTTK